MSVYESTPLFPLYTNTRKKKEETNLYTLNNSLLGRLNRGKMADVPNADPVCRRHSWQWQMYSARGFSRGVLKLTAPHWHVAFIFFPYLSLSVSMTVVVYVVACQLRLRCRRWPIGRAKARGGV